MNYAGKATVQATEDYTSIHDNYANQQREQLLIGKVSEKGAQALQEDAKRAAKVREEVKKAREGLSISPFWLVRNSIHHLEAD
jgi:nitrate reductase (NAD(P)H)